MIIDSESFNSFCVGKYPELIAFASLFLKGQDRAWAEDVVQDVLYGVWKRRFFISGDPRRIHAYLMKSVYNRCMNYLEHSSAIKKNEEEQAALLSLSRECYDPDRNPVIQALFDRDLRKAIDFSVGKLPDKQQEVFRLSYFEGKSHQEIAAILGISVRTVDAHIYSALKSLRFSLQNIYQEAK